MGISDSGYSYDALSLEWHKHFKCFSAKRQVRAWRLLLFDGHGSHCISEFVEYCNTHKIIPFCLPLHTTHLLQPLNVVVFQPYKHYHAKVIDAATCTGCLNFNKIEFFAAITSICQQTFKKSTILSSFRQTSLIPFDPNMIINCLQEFNPQSILSLRTLSSQLTQTILYMPLTI